MKTRSQSIKLNSIQAEEKQNIVLEFEYDFDNSSKCWKENKKFVGNGCYKYVCEGVTKKGIKCIRTSLDGQIYCKIHLSNNIII
jgi:hypothetical protein